MREAFRCIYIYIDIYIYTSTGSETLDSSPLATRMLNSDVWWHGGASKHVIIYIWWYGGVSKHINIYVW